MATYDSADLLARLARITRLPATRTYPTDPDLYALLTEAQSLVMVELATHAPAAVLSAPRLMSTDDSGATWTFGTDGDGDRIVPMGYAEVYLTNGGRPLFASSYAGGEGDVVFEGDHIRMPRGRTRTFDAGPYWRGVVPPLALNAGSAPVVPKPARMLIVYRAAALLASEGGLRDPEAYEAMYQRAWSGDPRTGEAGLLGALRTQFRATPSGLAWWQTWSASGGAAGLAALDASYLDGSGILDGSFFL